MNNVVDLHPEAEKRGLTPAQWSDVLYGYQGIECVCPGGEQGYKLDFYPKGVEYSVMFCEEGYPDGSFIGFNFCYQVTLRESVQLADVNEFNKHSLACCVLDDDSLRFYHQVNLNDAQVTESIIKCQIDKWMLALPGITAFAHRYGD